jgi:hypothetical protein
LCKTIRSVPRRGFLFYFVKNVDYVEIQIELDGAVEERRTRPVDRRIGPPACLLPQDGCRAERALIGSEGKSEKRGRHKSIIVSREGKHIVRHESKRTALVLGMSMA